MTNMFLGASAFNGNIEKWDVSSVVDMSQMFAGATSFNQKIGDWDVSAVELMNDMFAQAHAFNQSLLEWDVSAVTNMNRMFNSASSFNRNIGDWNVSNVESMSSMFRFAEDFNRSLRNWDVSSVRNMSSMFVGASSFNQDLSNWDISSVTTMIGMLSNSGLDVNNYDATINGWASLSNIPPNLTVGVEGLEYCNSESNWSDLENNHGWDFQGHSDQIAVENTINVTHIHWYGIVSAWSERRFPSSCDDVVIPVNINIDIEAGDTGLGLTLDVELGGSLTVPVGAELIISGWLN